MSTIGARAVLALTVAALLLTMLPGVAAAASRPTRFELYVGSSCVGGFSSDGANVELTWRRAGGKLVVHNTYRAASEGGYWEACAGDGFTTPLLRIGDRLEAKVGAAVRRFTVPGLTLRFDRVNDLFKGRAPAGTAARLAFAGGLYSDVLVSRSVSVDGDGRWRHREPGFDIVGGQYASLRWTSAKRDRVTIEGVAPFIRVSLGDSRFDGAHYAGTSFQARLIEVATGEVRAIGRATAGRHGSFTGTFRDASGQPVAVAAGLRLQALSLAGDARWIVPNVTGSASADSDVVKGRCFDAGTSATWYDVRVVAPDGDTRARSAGATSRNGSFEVDLGEESGGMFHSPGDIRSGDLAIIGCLQRGGDWAQRELIVP